MRYMGSKARIAKEILPIILKDRKPGQWYVEPFVGGANSIENVEGPRLASDNNFYLIECLKQIQKDPQIFPPNKKATSEEIYRYIKNNKDCVLPSIVGYYGFALSYGGKFFGGWCRDSAGKRDYVKEAYTNAIKQSPKLQGVKFIHTDYKDLWPPKNSIIYCDPPYQNATDYAGNFDHKLFWEWCKRMFDSGHAVFVSEYNAPEFVECMWEREQVSSLTKNTGSKKAVERLFTFKLNRQENNMSQNEGFVPVPITVTKIDNNETKAAVEVGRVAGDPEFLAIIQKQVKWLQVKDFKQLANDEQLAQAVELFDEMKKTLKALEAMRKGHVAFPTKVVDMINGLFRQVRANIVDLKGHVGGMIAAKRAEQEREYQRKLAEQQEREMAGQEEVVVVQDEKSGIGKVEFEPPAPIAPPNVIESGKGAKVHTRTDLEVEVVDLHAFLKLLVSRELRSAWIAEHYEELVTVNMGALKKLCKENPTKRKVKGLRIEKVTKTV